MENTMENTKVIILAAGQGTRMRSDLAKVLHEVKGQPMIGRVLDMVGLVSPDEIYLVIGHQAERVKAATARYDVIYVEQKVQLGTGHAVLMAEPALKNYDGLTIILCGDVPLLRGETVKELRAKCLAEKLDGIILTVRLDDPQHYGRIVRGPTGQVERIVEYRDATDAEKKIDEVNSGIYCFRTRELFAALRQIQNQNDQREYYLTDVIGIMAGQGKTIGTLLTADAGQVQGVNDLEDLRRAEARLQSSPHCAAR
ncbi:N-acetylglucosamine-1-phosphate uridyltransferase [Candidatus Termititenax persephonae]|uniref:N-acetylglucosamine-1-phosphate uridyltransferase n=1 Tax=Candidatus Termititenax persephonae TaxID=2218525 RepID=A0A388TEC6_9BACT|nr:N-acetylglucosamine-1-phosphate uridyltransferase [Candidatus Termititenax persephonae]